MGQKVNPTSFRLGITEQWRSRWYAPKKDYGKYAVEDERIRRFIKKEYSFAGIPRIDIERTREKTLVLLYAARPGVIIGRKGATIDKLTEDISTIVGHPVEVKIIEVEKPELNATLVAESIVEQLEKRAPFRRVIRGAVKTVMESGAGGVKAQVAGRLGGAEIARTEKIIIGKIPLHTLRADIDYGQATAVLTKGTIGVKVWIYKGEVFKEKENASSIKEKLANAADAQKGKVPKEPARPDER